MTLTEMQRSFFRKIKKRVVNRGVPLNEIKVYFMNSYEEMGVFISVNPKYLAKLKGITSKFYCFEEKRGKIYIYPNNKKAYLKFLRIQGRKNDTVCEIVNNLLVFKKYLSDYEFEKQIWDILDAEEVLEELLNVEEHQLCI